VRAVSRSSPYSDRIGIVEIEPIKDNFRFWYMVKFAAKGLDAVSRFAEEEIVEVRESTYRKVLTQPSPSGPSKTIYL
jgi:methionine synthase II (cobalamin-independent)